jgi:signal transduction histidine kinase
VLAAERDPEPEEVHATVALVLDELERMGRLVDGLLELASASEPGGPQVEPVDLGEALRRFAREFQVIGRREWRIDARVAEPTPLDPQALRQIVANLIRNAIAHSSDDSAIELAATRVNGGVDISVRDYGEGVDPAIRETLFERFVHGSDGGFGLGLAIAQTLARAQGGSLRHDAPPGGGTRFVLHLPVGGDGSAATR